MHLRAYTLIEVIIAMVIITLLLLGAIGLVRSYSMSLQWDRLFSVLEQEFFNANVYALAGVAANSADDEDPLVSVLPGMRHLYFQKGDVSQLLYLETVENGAKRKIIFSRRLKIDPAGDVNLKKIEFFDGFFEPPELLGASDQLLMSWASPLSELTFHGFSEDLFSNEVLNGQESFLLPPVELRCEKHPDQCLIKITFQDQRGDERGEFFDVQKGVERES
jgi:prepilin-type N-terminal cleavage/methylation domain-containing protein